MAHKLNVGLLQNASVRNEYQTMLDKQLQDIKVSELDGIDQIWDRLKASIEDIAEEFVVIRNRHKKAEMDDYKYTEQDEREK